MAADDKLDIYYREKIWDWIPEVYRSEDTKGVLRALVTALAGQAAVARRSIDRLWEDAFIELSDDWAVPYIGDLVGTRLVPAQNRAGRRVDVAKTIFYRRRKGTPFVLEQLIRDIARLDGALVEAFRRLARMRHGLDAPVTTRLEGRFTRTLPGGTANLRSPRGAEIVDGPFDEFAHTPDVRLLSGTRGRYNIPKLNFHIYRLEAFDVPGSTPGTVGAADPQRFTFDPSGRDVPLFMPGHRPDVCQLAKPWEVTAPIRCGLLGHSEYELTEADVVALGATILADAAEALRRLIGVRFRGERRLFLTLQAMDLELSPSGRTDLEDEFHAILEKALLDESGKAQLVEDQNALDESPDAIALERTPSGGNLDPVDVVAGDLLFWFDDPPTRGTSNASVLDTLVQAVIDPERGRVFFFEASGNDPTIDRYFYGFSAHIGAGPYDRQEFLSDGATSYAPGGGAITIPSSGVAEVPDSFTYTTNGDVSVDGNLKIQASNEDRSYVLNDEDPAPAPWIWTATGGSQTLELEGLWIGIDRNDSLDKVLALDGEWDRVVIRHCTLDPGGSRLLERDLGVTVTNAPVPVSAVILEIRGLVHELVIDASITGPIRVDGAGGLVEKLVVTDSIIQSQDLGANAIDLPATEADMQRVTIFGGVVLNRLEASEVLVAGVVEVTDNQHGCFRFSAAAPGSRLPRQFKSSVRDEIASRVFTSRRFGSPGYAQLRETAPLALRQGAEDGSEVGAFSALRLPIRLESLGIKVDEFKPVGLLPQFILET